MSEKTKKFADGFTIAEVLIALVVVSILLAAVAVAFNASAINYRENSDIFKAVNSARQALFRMTTQLRTADAVNPDSLSNECSLITAGGDDITYRYNSSAKRLYLVTNDITTDSDYVLCDNVTAMAFTKDIVTEGPQTKVKSVQISITVAAGDIQRTLAAAAVIRRNLN
jgi:prepilin-type N-terminal cleavage/methylation domain-containing protein